jgi:hypothetical protein
MRSGMASSRSKQPKQRRFVTPTMSLHQHVGNDLPPRPHSFIATSKLPRSLGVSNVKSHCVTPDYRSQSPELIDTHLTIHYQLVQFHWSQEPL